MWKAFIVIEGSFFLAVADIIDAAGKVGTMGMQTLLAFMLICLGIVVWYQDRQRTIERAKRDEEQRIRDEASDKRFTEVIKHHEATVQNFSTERSAFTSTLINLNDQSVKAMNGMTLTMEGLRVWLEDNLYRQHRRYSVAKKARTDSKS